MMTRLRQAIDEATRVLTEASVTSPRVDAEELAAHVARTDRGPLALLDIAGDDFFSRYADLIAARAKRIPLQHLTGTAAFGPLNLDVGPGVFISRSASEGILEWAVT